MSFTKMKKNVATGTPGQGGGQGHWFQRLSTAAKKRGWGDVVSTTAKNLGEYAKSLGRRANLASYNHRYMALSLIHI